MRSPKRKAASLPSNRGDRAQQSAWLECHVPHTVDQERRAQIRSAYQDSVTRVGPREDEYVKERLERVVSRLHTQGGASLQLARTARALGHVYFLECDLDRRLFDPGRRHILAALYYLCDPFDVMPDFRTSGYVDDALVVNRCLSALRNDWHELYKSVLEAA